MAGQIKSINVEQAVQGTDTIKPYIVQYEFYLEWMRQLDFEEVQSRFQIYFAFEDLDITMREVGRIYSGS